MWDFVHRFLFLAGACRSWWISKQILSSDSSCLVATSVEIYEATWSVKNANEIRKKKEEKIIEVLCRAVASWKSWIFVISFSFFFFFFRGCSAMMCLRGPRQHTSICMSRDPEMSVFPRYPSRKDTSGSYMIILNNYAWVTSAAQTLSSHWQFTYTGRATHDRVLSVVSAPCVVYLPVLYCHVALLCIYQ